MRRLAAALAAFAAFGQHLPIKSNEEQFKSIHERYEVEERPSVMYYGDPRKAARNHHRRMKASGRHNWRASK